MCCKIDTKENINIKRKTKKLKTENVSNSAKLRYQSNCSKNPISNFNKKLNQKHCLLLKSSFKQKLLFYLK